MQILAVCSLVGAIFMIGLGLLVFSKSRTSRLGFVFNLFCISVSIWLFGAFMMLTSKEDALAIFWDRIVYMGVVFIPALMYHISVAFAKLEQKQKKKLFPPFSKHFSNFNETFFPKKKLLYY